MKHLNASGNHRFASKLKFNEFITTKIATTFREKCLFSKSYDDTICDNSANAMMTQYVMI